MIKRFLLLPLAVLLAACGGEIPDSTAIVSNPSPSPTAEATATSTPIPASQSLPDLVVNTIQMDHSGCRVIVSVENVGKSDAAPFWVSMNGIEQTVPDGLAVAEVVHLHYVTNAHTIQVLVDAKGEIAEMEEKNNEGWSVVPETAIVPSYACDALDVTATPGKNQVDRTLPDLMIGNISPALDPAFTGTCWTPEDEGLQITIANYGAVAAGAFEVSASGMETQTIEGLEMNELVDVWAPYPTSNHYEVAIYIDSAQAVEEGSEANNRRYISPRSLPRQYEIPECTP